MKKAYYSIMDRGSYLPISLGWDISGMNYKEKFCPEINKANRICKRNLHVVMEIFYISG